MSFVRRLTFQLQALRTEVHRMVIAAGRPATVPPAHVPAPPPPQLEHLPPPVLAAPLPFHLPLTLFVLAPAVATPLSCPFAARQGIVTFTVTITVVTSTTLPALPLTHPTTLFVQSGNTTAVLFQFLVVQLVALLSHTTTAEWVSVQPTVQVEGAAVAPLHPRVSPTTLFPCLKSVRGRLTEHKLDLQVLCAQKPLMGTLPTDQSFRYDGPVGSFGGTPQSIRFPFKGLLISSSSVNVSSQVSSAFARLTPHMLASLLIPVWSSGARWQVLCIVSHPRSPMFLGVCSTPLFPLFKG